jgi:hypothetical protein
MLDTSASVLTGLLGHLRTTLSRSDDPLAQQLLRLWPGPLERSRDHAPWAPRAQRYAHRER